jgi:hypothetical protein
MQSLPRPSPARPVTALPRSSWPPLQRSRQRYAVLVDSLDDEHELAVVQGALAVARERDVRLFVVPGGPVGAPEQRLRTNNFAFDLVSAKNALGVLVLMARLMEHPLVEQGRTLFLLPIALGTEPLGVAAFSVTLQLAQSELLEDLRELLAPVLKEILRRHV